METSSTVAANAGDREVVITRIFDAPRSLVFKAWTEPEHMVKWFGPKDFTATIIENDVRSGGLLLRIEALKKIHLVVLLVAHPACDAVAGGDTAILAWASPVSLVPTPSDRSG